MLTVALHHGVARSHRCFASVNRNQPSSATMEDTLGFSVKSNFFFVSPQLVLSWQGGISIATRDCGKGMGFTSAIWLYSTNVQCRMLSVSLHGGMRASSSEGVVDLHCAFILGGPSKNTQQLTYSWIFCFRRTLWNSFAVKCACDMVELSFETILSWYATVLTIGEHASPSPLLEGAMAPLLPLFKCPCPVKQKLSRSLCSRIPRQNVQE